MTCNAFKTYRANPSPIVYKLHISSKYVMPIIYENENIFVAPHKNVSLDQDACTISALFCPRRNTFRRGL